MSSTCQKNIFLHIFTKSSWEIVKIPSKIFQNLVKNAIFYVKIKFNDLLYLLSFN